MSPSEKLKKIRRNVESQTTGLADAVIESFLSKDKSLGTAISNAFAAYEEVLAEFPDLLKLSERNLTEILQDGYVNFYPEDQRNPYVALGASGPWIITAHGAVIHDSGGYGMLGFGHAPEEILAEMAKPQVMANVMTASFSHHRLYLRLQAEIGKGRSPKPFKKYICMNSGSESVSVAARISDINAKTMTDPGGRHYGKKIMFLALKGGFHGRTDRPAQASASSKKKYDANLATFRDRNVLHTVQPNDLQDLDAQFKWAAENNVFFESMLIEPVMGEGDPGKSITPEFYARAREHTKNMGSLLIVDSIQASLRAHGCLSILDYPGFEKTEAPDLETYSKAINAGQYPVSILALTESCSKIYVKGVYGNSMTTNPRAIQIACAVMDMFTPAIGQNIRDRSAEIMEKLLGLQKEFPEIITKVQGTGLLISAEISAKKFKVVGNGHLEEYLRTKGMGVIHGGENSLRFTPHFRITSPEVNLMIDLLRDAFKNGPLL